MNENIVKKIKVNSAPTIKQIIKLAVETFLDFIKPQKRLMGNNPPIIIRITIAMKNINSTWFCNENKRINSILKILTINNHVRHDNFANATRRSSIKINNQKNNGN